MRGARDEVGGMGRQDMQGLRVKVRVLGSNGELLEALSRAVVLSDQRF